MHAEEVDEIVRGLPMDVAYEIALILADVDGRDHESEAARLAPLGEHDAIAIYQLLKGAVTAPGTAWDLASEIMIRSGMDADAVPRQIGTRDDPDHSSCLRVISCATVNTTCN